MPSTRKSIPGVHEKFVSDFSLGKFLLGDRRVFQSEPCFCCTKTLADVRFAYIGTGVRASLALPPVRLLMGQ